MTELSDYRRIVSDPLEETLRKTIAIQVQTLAAALADLSVAEDALVSQTALVRAQGERMAALQAGLRKIADGCVGPQGVAHYLTHRRCMAIARALLSPPPQDKEGAG